jgi:hypothetical protein
MQIADVLFHWTFISPFIACLLNEENWSVVDLLDWNPCPLWKLSVEIIDCHSNISVMLQEDCEKLKHPSLTPCSRLAVQLRISEKMLLDTAEEYVKQRIKTWTDKHILINQPYMWFSHKMCDGLQLFWGINRHFASNLVVSHVDTSRFMSMWTVVVHNDCE